jgi:phage major head subunit gpT-like protein
MYIPSALVLQKTLNAAFEMAKREQLANYQLSGLDNLYLTLEAVDGKLDLSWLGDVPVVREWIGSKVYGDLKEFAYSLIAKDFYDGFTIHKKALRRGDTSSIKPRIDQLARNLNFYEAELVLAALMNGTTGVAYDGQAFFADRSVNDNLLAGSGITLAQVMADLAAARQAMMKMVTDKGRFTRYVPDTVICPVAMEPTFLQIKNSTVYPGGTNGTANPYGAFIKNVIALPDLTDANDWYYLATGMSVKPLVFGFEKLENGQRVLPVLDESKLASDGAYGYSCELSGIAGYGFYEMAIKTVNT